jgi:superfamily II DNA/RNA helicase
MMLLHHAANNQAHNRNNAPPSSPHYIRIPSSSPTSPKIKVHHRYLLYILSRSITIHSYNTVPLIDFQSTNSLDRKLVHTLQLAMNITKRTPVQSHAIPLLLNQYDVMASSATGSGKTIMFGLPLLQKVINARRRRGGNGGGVGGVGMPSSLVIAPTREVSRLCPLLLRFDLLLLMACHESQVGLIIDSTFTWIKNTQSSHL